MEGLSPGRCEKVVAAAGAKVWRRKPGPAASRDVAHDPGSERRCQRDRNSFPDPGPPRIPFVIRRRSLGHPGGGALIPPELLLARAPLQVEPMGASARRATTKVEELQSLLGGPLHEAPVQEHVGRKGVVGGKRAGPGDLEFAIPAEPCSARDGLATV